MSKHLLTEDEEQQLKRIKELYQNEAFSDHIPCITHYCCSYCKREIGVIWLPYDKVEDFVYSVKMHKQCYEEQLDSSKAQKNPELESLK